MNAVLLEEMSKHSIKFEFHQTIATKQTWFELNTVVPC